MIDTIAETGVSPSYIETWANTHQKDIQTVSRLLTNNKAVLVEGAVGSGKTTLAQVVTGKLKQESKDKNVYRITKY